MADFTKLRALRLWHWQQCLLYRELEGEARACVDNNAERRWQAFYKQAGFHLKAVTTLNDFFPAGDTAEKDNDNG